MNRMRYAPRHLQDQILAIIDETGSASAAAMARTMRKSETTIGNALWAMKIAGTVEKSGTLGPGTRWGRPGMAPRAEFTTTARQREERRAQAKRAAGAEAFAVAWLAEPPQRIIVPASMASMLKTGPCSVWEWAQA